MVAATQWVQVSWTYNNNNNNNAQDNVYGAVIMAEPLREFTRFILMNVEWRQAAADPGPSQTT